MRAAWKQPEAEAGEALSLGFPHAMRSCQANHASGTERTIEDPSHPSSVQLSTAPAGKQEACRSVSGPSRLDPLGQESSGLGMPFRVLRLNLRRVAQNQSRHFNRRRGGEDWAGKAGLC
jgi:hypothetical protein